MNTRFERDVNRVVLARAFVDATERGSETVEAEHLLLALAGGGGDEVAALLVQEGLDRDGVASALERETERSLAAVGVAPGDFALPPRRAPGRNPKIAASTKTALQRAARRAAARKDRRVGRAHVLLGLLDAELGTVPRALDVAGVDRVALAARAERLLPSSA